MEQSRQRGAEAILYGLLLLCTLGAGAIPSPAQPTNLSVYQDLALRCLAGAPDTLGAFRLDAPDGMPYLRTALVDAWQADGRTLFLLPDSAAQGRPRLTYRVEEAGVTYERAPGRRLNRTVTLALRYTLTGPDGRLLAESACRETFADSFPRRAHAAVESPSFPETQAALPPAGWLRRYVEPALLTAATAIGVYLFFTLRSQATEGE